MRLNLFTALGMSLFGMMSTQIAEVGEEDVFLAARERSAAPKGGSAPNPKRAAPNSGNFDITKAAFQISALPTGLRAALVSPNDLSAICTQLREDRLTGRLLRASRVRQLNNSV